MVTIDIPTFVLIIIAAVLIGRAWRHLVRTHRSIKRRKGARK